MAEGGQFSRNLQSNYTGPNIYANNNVRLSLLENLSTPGNILFAPKTNISYSTIKPRATTSLSITDFNGDGKADIAGSSISQDSPVLCVFHNLKIEQDLDICAGEGLSLLADIQGNSYQWQVDTGAGFKNLVDDSNISGSDKFTLSINSIPSSWYGYKLRCLIDGKNSSKTSVVRVLSFFTGLYDSNWENPKNWSCGILPDKDTEVIVMDQVALTINSNVAVRKLRVMYGFTTVKSGFSITITH